MTGNLARIGRGAGNSRRGRNLVRKVAVEKFMPQSGPVADRALAGAVIRDEKAHSVVEHQMQIGMKTNRIAAVTDDSVSVAGFFVKAQRHSVQVRTGRKLPGMHQNGGFRAKDSDVIELPILQVSGDE